MTMLGDRRTIAEEQMAILELHYGRDAEKPEYSHKHVENKLKIAAMLENRMKDMGSVTFNFSMYYMVAKSKSRNSWHSCYRDFSQYVFAISLSRY